MILLGRTELLQRNNRFKFRYDRVNILGSGALFQLYYATNKGHCDSKSFKEDNVVCDCWKNSFVLLLYTDIELLIFSVVYQIGQASTDLSCAMLESSSYRWWVMRSFMCKAL